MKARPSMYQRPSKPLFKPVPQRDWMARTISAEPIAAPVMVDRGTECHVTPPSVAAVMVRAAGYMASGSVLEPSAGTGNIARAILAASCDPDRLVMVELHCTLAGSLRQSVGPVEQADFLELAAEWRGVRQFARIIMNPPFSRVRAHVAAAESLLAPGGVLVALVPITYQNDAAEDIETLPADTFAHARVNTKIVRITKR